MAGIEDLHLPQTFISNSAAETRAFAEIFGSKLAPNTSGCFVGDLGAGKTTFVQGVNVGILGHAEEVNSPTFTYLNIYQGNQTLYHFDLYRLRDADEFLGMGFDEFFDAGGITCVEWAEKIEGVIPDEAICIKIGHLGGDQRKVEIFYRGVA